MFLFSVAYFSRGTLPQKRNGEKGHQLLGDLDDLMPKGTSFQPKALGLWGQSLVPSSLSSVGQGLL